MLGWVDISCNVASAEAISMYLLDRYEMCVCEGSLFVSAVEWSSLCNTCDGEVCWGRGGGVGGGGKWVSLVMLPVQRKSLCTYLTGVKCVCVKGLWLCLQWSGHLCELIVMGEVCVGVVGLL